MPKPWGMLMNCVDKCVVAEATVIPQNNMPPPAGGGGGDFTGITTANTTSINLTGNGLPATPLRATLQPVTIEFEIASSVPQSWANNQILLAYAAGHAFTLQAGLPGFHGYSLNLGTDATANLFKIAADTTASQIGTIVFHPDNTETVTFAIDVAFTPADTFLIRGVGGPSFDVVALTIIGLRQLAIAA